MMPFAECDDGTFGARMTIRQGKWQIVWGSEARKPLIFKHLRAFCAGNQEGKDLGVRSQMKMRQDEEQMFRSAKAARREA